MVDPAPEADESRFERLTTKGGFRRLEFILVASLAAFVVALAAVSIWAGVGQVLNQLGRLSPLVVLAMLGLALVNYGLRAWRWQHFAVCMGIHIPWRLNTLYYVAGFAMTTTPGKAGEALRLWLIERCHGERYEHVAPMFIADRLSDMVATTLMCVAGIGALSTYADLTFAAAAGLALMLVPFLRPRVALWLVNRLYGALGQRWPRLFARVRIALRRTAELFTLRRFGFGLILALFGWAAEVLGFYLVLHQLGAAIGFQQAMFILTFGMIAGAVSMLPGGIGGTEGAMLALLATAGVDFDIAITAVAVTRLTTLWFAAVLGFVALPAALRRARKGVAGRAAVAAA